MSRADVFQLMQTTLNQLLESKGASPVQLAEDSVLLDGDISIDSLDLAQIVLELQAETGLDPFADGFTEFRTAGELAGLFSA